MSPSNISGSTDASRDSRRTIPTTTPAATVRSQTPEQPRSPQPDQGPEQRYDLLVIGGGINGTGIARDAAGRGLSVLLCEQDDLAAHTSSASTKLIHGGLRYLEDFHFALVRKALLEREVLLNAAPHIMRPLHFVMPHDAHLRPMWMIRAGLFLYDHLAPRKRLAASAEIDLRKHIAGEPLDPRFQRGFVYSDGWTDDARLVVLNAVDAAARGAVIATRTRCTKIEAVAGEWQATLEDVRDHVGAGVRENGSAAIRGSRSVQARVVVNAAGPWVSRFITGSTPIQANHRVRLVKGSHIVVPKLFTHRFAYIFQNEDRRIVFAIPYEREFTLIGTTDVDYQGEPQDVRIEPAEIAYLCAIANRYFTRRIGPDEVVWSYSGVRPLVNDEATDPSSVTRDYLLELDREPAPMLSVFGGKITTFRKLAETAVDQLTHVLGANAGPHRLQGPGRLQGPDRLGGPWTKGATLPGGDLPGGSFAVFLRTVERRYPWLPVALRRRYAQSYGTRIDRVLGNANSLQDLGAELLPQLYEREAEYLCREEFARTAEDILWRRSKLGLHLRGQTTSRLEDWLRKRD